jgi:hypothetical protein
VRELFAPYGEWAGLAAVYAMRLSVASLPSPSARRVLAGTRR